MKKIKIEDFPKNKNNIFELIKNKTKVFMFGAGVISEKTLISLKHE